MESMVFRGAVAWLLMCSVVVSIRPVKWPAEVAGDAVREPWFYDLGKHATIRHARTCAHGAPHLDPNPNPPIFCVNVILFHCQSQGILHFYSKNTVFQV